MPPRVTKLQRLRGFVETNDVRRAIRLAASFPQLGSQKERITRAAACLTDPEVYRQMGYSPPVVLQDGFLAIKERYQIYA